MREREDRNTSQDTMFQRETVSVLSHVCVVYFFHVLFQPMESAVGVDGRGWALSRSDSASLGVDGWMAGCWSCETGMTTWPCAEATVMAVFRRCPDVRSTNPQDRAGAKKRTKVTSSGRKKKHGLQSNFDPVGLKIFRSWPVGQPSLGGIVFFHSNPRSGEHHRARARLAPDWPSPRAFPPRSTFGGAFAGDSLGSPGAETPWCGDGGAGWRRFL